MVKISVQGIPPYKQSPADSSEKKTQQERKKLLEKKAKETMISRALLVGNLKMKIIYLRCRGRSDPANIIGGIADVLQSIVYQNDSQLKSILYEESRGNRDFYTVEIQEIT